MPKSQLDTLRGYFDIRDAEHRESLRRMFLVESLELVNEVIHMANRNGIELPLTLKQNVEILQINFML